MIIKMIKGLFAKWEMVYSTADFDEYSIMKGILEDKGIPYKTKRVSPGVGEDGEKSVAANYMIFVPNALVQNAKEAIHE